MASRENALLDLTPEVLLKAYACGIFPMAETADDPALYWIEPEKRGIIPLDAFHVPARLARTVRNTPFTVTCDRDFAAVIDGCAAPGPKRARTWINTRIRQLYGDLFDIGHCHTVEVYDGARLVGGLYGVRLGRAFFGESMFHRRARRLEDRAGASGRADEGGRLPAARHAVPHRSPEAVRRDRTAARALSPHAHRRAAGRRRHGRVLAAAVVGRAGAGGDPTLTIRRRHLLPEIRRVDPPRAPDEGSGWMLR